MPESTGPGAAHTGKTTEKKTFGKNERLCSRKEIDRLFADNKAIGAAPLRLVYTSRNHFADIPCQCMFVVPKKKFRKAHDRNRLRRRIKEAYRLQKHILYEQLRNKDQRISMAIIYTGNNEENYEKIRKAVAVLLNKLCAAV